MIIIYIITWHWLLEMNKKKKRFNKTKLSNNLLSRYSQEDGDINISAYFVSQLVNF